MKYRTIRNYLEKTGKTESEFAGELGITQAYVNEIKNHKKRPSPELAAKIEEITGIPFRDLLMGSKRSAA